MKLTTDYERQKLAFGDKFGASVSRGECVCRVISTRIIEHGSLVRAFFRGFGELELLIFLC